MKQIIVKSQVELNCVPDSFTGQIIIDGGAEDNPIIINKQYYFEPVIINHSVVHVIGRATVKAQNHATVLAYGRATVKTSGYTTVFLYNKAQAFGHGKCIIVAKHQSRVTAFGFCEVRVWDSAICKVSGNVEVMGFGRSRSYMRQESRIYLYSSTAKAYFKAKAKAI